MCADHPAFGYVDHRPLSVWILAVWKRLLGEALVAIRLLPALVGAACVVLGGEFARALDGGRWAQRLTALAMVAAPVYLGTHHVFSMNSFAALLWLLAMRAVIAALDAPRRWPLAVAWLVVAAILLLGGRSRGNYLVPAYPPLLAAGAVALERFAGRRGRMVRALPFAVLVLGSAPLVPLAIPILPVERYIPYAKALGQEPSTDERKEVGPLSQHYADMHGWQELTDLVVRAWETLTPEERARAAIFGQNYGEAGAVTVLGRRRGLPEAISGHNNFWHWGPPKRGDGSIVVIIGGDEADHMESFASVTAVDTLHAPLAMPYERGLTVFIGRGLRRPLAEAWGRVRHYD